MQQRFVKYQPGERSSFYREVQQEITLYLKNKKGQGLAGPGMKAKLLFCLVVFAVTYSQYIHASYSYAQWLLWCIAMGFASMLVAINIGHDAVHQALFKKKWMNDVAGLSFDLTGISSYTWKLKHNLVHHRFPNVTGVDFDIEASPFLRLSPADKWRWYHRYQHWYAPLIYTLFSLSLVFINDIIVLLKVKRQDIDGNPHPKRIYAVVLFYKILYLAGMIGLPVLLLPFAWWEVLLGFVFMHAVLSLLLAFVLLPSHLFEQTHFSSEHNGIIHEDWALHQLRTTLDFSAGNPVINFLFGGFNTNVVHHLFPRICHYHYKPLSAIIEKKAAALNVPYHHTTLAGAIRSHFRTLKKLGAAPAITI